MRRAGQRSIKPAHISHLSLIVFIAAAAGSRLLFVLTNSGSWAEMWSQLSDSVRLTVVGTRGISMLGGLVIAILVIIWYCRLAKIQVFRLFDVMAPSFGLGIFLARIGCFLNGCCYGKPCDLPWCMKFPVTSPAGQRFPDVSIHPAQLYAAFSGLIIAVILLQLDRRKRFDGFLFCWLGILFGAFRIAVDLFKYYTPQKYCMLYNNPYAMNQFISVSMIVVGVFLYFDLRRQWKQSSDNTI